MDEIFSRNLRILIILAVIAITGLEIISANPSIWWIYGILVVVILAILFVRERGRGKKSQI
jgi:hypothetical protein